MLTKEAILKADDRPTEEVDVPEWGGSVLVQGLNGRQRDEYFASMTEIRGNRQRPVMNTADATAKLVALCVVDEDGHLLFEPADIEALTVKSGAALDRIFTVAQRLSGLTEEDMADLGKGSAPAPTAGSTSG